MFTPAHSERLFSEAQALIRKLNGARSRLAEAQARALHASAMNAALDVLEAERDIHVLDSSLRYGFGVHSFPAGRSDA